MDNKLVSFENNFYDEEPENGIVKQIFIDGFPADENAEGCVVAKVIKTQHNDIVTVFCRNDYRLNNNVRELIEDAKQRLQSEILNY